MKKNVLVAFIIVFAVILQSCGSTNKLGKYNLSGEKVLFDCQGNDAELQTDLKNSDIDTGVEPVNVVLEFAKSVATQYVTDDVEQKLYRAAEPQKIGEAVAGELKKTMVTYTDITPVEKVSRDYNYIVTTFIDEIILKSNGKVVNLSISARCEMRKRHTAELIWEADESETVPLKSYLDDVEKDDYDDNVSDVILLSELATISEEQLSKAVMLAAKKVGRELAEEFTEDLSDSSR